MYIVRLVWWISPDTILITFLHESGDPLYIFFYYLYIDIGIQVVCVFYHNIHDFSLFWYLSIFFLPKAFSFTYVKKKVDVHYWKGFLSETFCLLHHQNFMYWKKSIKCKLTSACGHFDVKCIKCRLPHYIFENCDRKKIPKH